MGEYAKHNGHRIKIGTCEDLYYLRADQADQVQSEPGNVNPITDADSIRFRFPFPTEDSNKPGEFEHHNFGLAVNCKVAVEFEHDPIQFNNGRGLLVSLPCPEAPEGNPHQIVKNGYPGNVRIVQQRLVKGQLVLICECGSCRAKFRLPSLMHAEPVIEALRERAKPYPPNSPPDSDTKFYLEVAQRIIDGYTKPNLWTDIRRPATQAECIAL